MRPIKFRGKRKDNGEWVVGNLVQPGTVSAFIVGPMIEANEEYCNLEWWHPIDAKTVGQFCGLKDKNGKPIFEGDILRASTLSSFQNQIYVCELRCLAFGFRGTSKRINGLVDYTWDTITNDSIKQVDLEVIGNLYENPELLKGGSSGESK